MAIQTNKIDQHWNYFLAIERDLENLARYIEFDQRNFDCFSIECARILLAAGAEVDVVSKLICKSMNSRSRANNIQMYKKEIKKHYPGIPNFKVSIERFGMTLEPWDEWKKVKGHPFWWKAYTETKHRRDTQYHLASLKNSLNAIAGLYVLLIYLHKDLATIGQLTPNPCLLRPEMKNFGGMSMGSYELGICYIDL